MSRSKSASSTSQPAHVWLPLTTPLLSQVQNMQNTQQLLNQALRGGNPLQGGLPQQLPPQAQLQSEALIAMQRQQALSAQGGAKFFLLLASVSTGNKPLVQPSSLPLSARIRHLAGTYAHASDTHPILLPSCVQA